MRMELKLEKLWNRVEVTGFCWLWKGNCNPEGYGSQWWEGRNQKAHRVIYTLLVGPIPEGAQLDHLCRVRNCVNPDHVEPVTHAVNQSRKKAKWAKPKDTTPSKEAQRKAAGLCKKGHVLAEVGVLESVRSNGSVRKQCRLCQHNVQERYRRKKGLPERGRVTSRSIRVDNAPALV
jgi:hypothetical protein